MGWPRATTSADEGADEDPSGADTPHHGHDVGPLGQRGRRRPRRWWRRHCGGDGTAVTLWWRDRAGQPAGDGQTVHSDAGSRFTSVGFAEASPSRASPPRSDRSATPPSDRVRGADRPAVSRLRPWGAGELEPDGPPRTAHGGPATRRSPAHHACWLPHPQLLVVGSGGSVGRVTGVGDLDRVHPC